MIIEYTHLNNEINYDGSQINPFWALKEHNIKGSSIISWIGSMNIMPDNLKDFEDVGLEIKSDKMIHFICEFFDTQPANMEIAYLRQRLLVLIFKEKLLEKGIIADRSGDDLFVENKKLSVSIATASISSMKIHFGINLTSKGTPIDIETIGLFELVNNSKIRIFQENNIVSFINSFISDYIDELKSIKLDIAKSDIS
ncbi:MAG: DUF366 family protein [Methanobrevibacter sp.]|jgi:hypothetical protein|nr:DUF366 family protein [Candidatus Methanoflexus mossambicus]